MGLKSWATDNIFTNKEGDANLLGKAADAYTAYNTLGLWSTDFQKNAEKEKAQKAIDDANAQPEKEYAIDPRVKEADALNMQEYLAAKNRAKYGLSEEEKNLAINQNAQGQNMAIMNANRLGGNASNYLNGVINSQNNNFGLSLAAQDQAIQRQKQNDVLPFLQNYNSTTGMYQDVANNEVERLYRIKLLKQQAAGQAMQDTLKRADARTAQYGQLGQSVLSGFATGGASMAGGQKPAMGNTYAPAPTGTPYNDYNIR